MRRMRRGRPIGTGREEDREKRDNSGEESVSPPDGASPVPDEAESGGFSEGVDQPGAGPGEGPSDRREAGGGSEPGPKEVEGKVIPFPAVAEPEETVEEEEESPPGSRRRLKVAILVLLVFALLGNTLAFLPSIYNLDALRFLRKSAELSQMELIREAKRAVVVVRSDDGKGTGFNIAPDGLIVTNHHVIEDGLRIVVDFGSYGTFAVRVEAGDPEVDIAFLRLIGAKGELPVLELAEENRWMAGQPFYVIGNPLFFSRIANEGTVLGPVSVAGRTSPVLALQAPIYKGNSGSPVLNSDGKVIAVVYATAKFAFEGGETNAGLAIPVEAWKDLIP
mgnify:CR=1 FL=1